MSKSERIPIDHADELERMVLEAPRKDGGYLIYRSDVQFTVYPAASLIRSQREEIARLKARVQELEGGASKWQASK